MVFGDIGPALKHTMEQESVMYAYVLTVQKIIDTGYKVITAIGKVPIFPGVTRTEVMKKIIVENQLDGNPIIYFSLERDLIL